VSWGSVKMVGKFRSQKSTLAPTLSNFSAEPRNKRLRRMRNQFYTLGRLDAVYAAYSHGN
jgi:hypothetical protein